MSKTRTINGKKGGLLEGKPHYDKDGNSLGGIKAVVTDAGGKPVELEGGEVIINKEASKKYWKELSKINQSAGNGVPILPPDGAVTDEDPEEFSEGGNIIEFNPNHLPNKWITEYALKIKEDYPEIWKKGGNIFGNEAFVNLVRVRERGHWLDSEEWMYIKWRSYVARHKKDFRIEGVVAMLKWCDKVEKGWGYMKTLIEKEIANLEKKKKPSAFRQAIKEKSLFKDGGKVSKTNDSCQVLDKDGNPAIDDKSLRKMEKCIMKLTQTKDMNLNPNGKYKLARRKLHKKIIDEFKKNAVCITKGQPIAILMGGSPASGKSSFLRKYRPFLLQEEILKVDADEIRAKLPEYKGYNATQTHQETKDIVTTLISDRNIGVPCDFDLIYDGTMNNVRSYKPLIELLRSRNYKIFIVYMDKVPKEVIMQRMKDRYLKTGRFVPAEVVDDFFKKGTSAFEELKPLVDGYLVIDGSNQDYDIIEKGGMQLPEDRAYSKLGQKISPEELEKIEYKRGGNLDKIDSVELDIPLLIRVMEFAREDVKSDPELHHVVERLIEIRDKGVLTMKDYDFIADLKKKEKFSEIERKYANGGTVLLAPNGKPSNLTTEQYKLVRTPEFKAWFGDWENDPENASKVVDSNGEPLIMYHGTLSDFNIFDKEKWGYNTFSDIRGFFFSNGKEEAQSYMEENVIFGGTGIKNGFLLECFLNLKEPIIETIWDEDEPSLYIDNQIHLVKYNKGNGLIVENKDKNWVTAVVFEPNQIKLADGTNTTFDPNNDDIRFETGGLIAPNGNPTKLTPNQHKLVRTPEFKAWFGDWENDPKNASKVVDSNGEPLVVYHGTKDNFSIFDIEKVGTKTDTGMWGKGFYFTSSKKYAETYSNKPFDFKTGKVLSEKGFILDVFLSLKKPYIIKNTSDIPKITIPNETIDDLINSDNLYSEKFRKKLIDDGYDGVFVKFEFNFRGGRDYELVSFYPDQIKLADGTNTTFDPNNDDIRYKQGGRTTAQTPAPSKERIYGSEKNKPRSSKDSSSAESIKFDEKTLTSIENKLKEHNESHPDVKVNLATAKAVVRRGMGAYSKSHRPTISGGQPNSRVAWGLARLNAFLYKAVHGESKSGKYSQDNDLLDELSIAHDKFKTGGEIAKKNKNGNCYEKAGKMILYANTKYYPKIDYIGKPYLVHAQVTGQGAIEGVKYGHAWIEDDAFVYDYSNKRKLKVPKALYYEIGQIIEQQPIHFKYTFEEARRKMNEIGHYGSWDLITESGL